MDKIKTSDLLSLAYKAESTGWDLKCDLEHAITHGTVGKLGDVLSIIEQECNAAIDDLKAVVKMVKKYQ